MNRPGMAGLRHVALSVHALEACEDFYVRLMGMRVEWRPDPDNVYLTSGTDNLALHRAALAAQDGQRLDHIGFVVNTPADVDLWHEYLNGNGVNTIKLPRTHRDGARSFYCMDPDGTVIQVIFHPPIAGGKS